MSYCQFPNEIIIKILLRLPVKSLLRFKCVSKSWYSTITHRSFIKMHLTHARSLHASYLLHVPPEFSGRQLCSLYCDRTIAEHSKLEIPFESESASFELVGSCDSLLCLNGLLRFILWPNCLYLESIQKFKTFGFYNANHPINRSMTFSFLGYSFDREHNEYKVVTILDYGYHLSYYLDSDMPEVHVYLLSTDSCRKVEALVPCLLNYYQPWATIFKGFMPWTASKQVKGLRHVNLIMSLDISDKVFGEIMLTDHHNDKCPSEFFVRELKESLSLLRTYSNECKIWMMKEYGVAESWSMPYSITLDTGFYRLMGFVGQEIILEKNLEEYVLYNLENNEFTEFGLLGSLWKLFKVVVMESLVLLEQGNQASEQEIC